MIIVALRVSSLEAFEDRMPRERQSMAARKVDRESCVGMEQVLWLWFLRFVRPRLLCGVESKARRCVFVEWKRIVDGESLFLT